MVTITHLLPAPHHLSLQSSWLCRRYPFPFSSTSCIHLCTRCQEELFQAKERNRLGSSQTCVTGKIGHLAVTQLLRSALFGPLQPRPVLGLPILREAAAHGHLKKWGEERHRAVSCRQTREHSPTRRWPPEHREGGPVAPACRTVLGRGARQMFIEHGVPALLEALHPN